MQNNIHCWFHNDKVVRCEAPPTAHERGYPHRYCCDMHKNDFRGRPINVAPLKEKVSP